MKMLLKSFFILLIISKTYQICDVNCLQCEETTCVECKDNFFLVSADTSCVDSNGCPAGTVAISDNKTCSCDSSCYECSGTSINCTECYDSYLYNNACYSGQCPEKTYDPDEGSSPADYTGWRCEACNPSCLACSLSATACSACSEEGKYAYMSQCELASVCEANQKYGSDVTKKCEACQSPCKTCSGSALNCLSCVTAKYLEGNQCVETCQSHYFEDGLTQHCVVCAAKCKECDVISSNCTQCPTGDNTYLSNYDCLLECPAGTFHNNSDVNNRLCSNCLTPCSECLGSQSICTKCTFISGLYLLANQCSDSCPVGQFKNQTETSDRKCSVCVSPCIECTSASYCTKCDGNTQYYLTENTCSLVCPAGTFMNKSNLAYKICSDCQSPCKTCEGAQTTCNSCITDYLYYSPNNTCFSECPVGTFEIDINCQDCDDQTAYCSECLVSETNCTKCTQISSTYLNLNTCVSFENCPIGTYPDSNLTDNKICKTCPQNCSECTNGTECTKCKASSNYFLHLKQCIQKCPSGTYPEETDVNNRICVACESPCAECSAAVDNCTKCTVASGQYLKVNTCVDECGAGYYDDKTATYKLCTICVAPCVECDSAVVCTRCDKDQELYLDKNLDECVGTCPIKTFKNSTDTTKKECTDCLEICENCLNKTYCLECTVESNFYLLDNNCVDKCPDGTYVDSTVNYKLCTFCVNPCILCKNDTYCQQCSQESGKYLTNNECQVDCPSKTFKNSTDIRNKMCSNCIDSCSECVNNANKCTQCVPSLYLYNNVCLLGNNCPQNTFANATTEDDRLCSACQSPCLECNVNENSCTKCEQYSNTYLIVSQYLCVNNTECPKGTFADKTDVANKICSDCISPCAECYVSGTYCTRCTAESGKFLSKNVCEDNCPDGTFKNLTDNDNKLCSSCSYPCISCTEAECTKCDEYSGTILINGECIHECPVGQYLTLIEGVESCENCNSPCEECYDTADACTMCTEDSGLYLSGWECVLGSECPDETYPDNSNVGNKICQPINPANTIYSYKTIALAALMAFVIFIYTTMIKI